jgi:hypothetical protein
VTMYLLTPKTLPRRPDDGDNVKAGDDGSDNGSDDGNDEGEVAGKSTWA